MTALQNCGFNIKIFLMVVNQKWLTSQLKDDIMFLMNGGGKHGS